MNIIFLWGKVHCVSLRRYGTSKMSGMGLESRSNMGRNGQTKKNKIQGGRCKFGVLLDGPWEALMGAFY
jgi:hypothetical protein